MRILHVTHQYSPAVGGAEQHIADVSEELARRGHQVTVLTSRSRNYLTWANELPGRERLAGVEVHRFRSLGRAPWTWRLMGYGYDRYGRSRARRFEPLILLGSGPLCPGLFAAVIRRAARCDVLHINNLHYSHAATAYLAARLRGLPVVLTPHVHVEQPVTYDVGYMWRMLRHSDHVVADTRGERQFLLDRGLDPWRVTTAGVGLRAEELSVLDRQACRRELDLPEDAFVILFLGRKTEYKGLDLVLEAFATLQAQHPQLYLLTVGAGTETSATLLARYAGLPRLIDRGNVPDAVRLAALNACDCLALPSAAEAFGRVFLEAWAAGKPVIGARTRSVGSIVTDGADGYLVAPGSAAEVAGRIACLLANPGLAAEMGARGRAKLLNRYTTARIGDIIEAVYLRVLRRRRGAAGQFVGEK